MYNNKTGENYESSMERQSDCGKRQYKSGGRQPLLSPRISKKEYLTDSDKTYTCPWKGFANYYHIDIDGEKNENAAWSYHDPKEKAEAIRDHYAFWHGVEVKE